eukprot:10767948-Lingulodinium_polyedra.AAC.1
MDRHIARARMVNNRERQARALSQGVGKSITLTGAPAEGGKPGKKGKGEGKGKGGRGGGGGGDRGKSLGA